MSEADTTLHTPHTAEHSTQPTPIGQPAATPLDENTLAFHTLMSRYRCAMMEMETKFKVLNEEFSLRYDRNPIEGIKTRLKRPAEIHNKMLRKGFPLTLEAVEQDLNDIAGVRVICAFAEDIYLLASCLLQQDDIVLLAWKDYIDKPKPNGYRSLHLIIEIPIFLHNEKRAMKVEVQLRTIAMDFWASLEHKLRYKKDLSPEMLAILEADLHDCAQTSAALDAKMQDIRNRIQKAQEV
ncbi:MAG: GTP pyrophosphokinase family protein [Faecalibacterium sp.]